MLEPNPTRAAFDVWFMGQVPAHAETEYVRSTALT